MVQLPILTHCTENNLTIKNKRYPLNILRSSEKEWFQNNPPNIKKTDCLVKPLFLKNDVFTLNKPEGELCHFSHNLWVIFDGIFLQH